MTVSPRAGTFQSRVRSRDGVLSARATLARAIT